jgi:hypothetical protein
MSQENMEVVRRSIAAFEGDEETWLATIDPSHVWYPLEEGNIPSHGSTLRAPSESAPGLHCVQRGLVGTQQSDGREGAAGLSETDQ